MGSVGRGGVGGSFWSTTVTVTPTDAPAMPSDALSLNSSTTGVAGAVNVGCSMVMLDSVTVGPLGWVHAYMSASLSRSEAEPASATWSFTYTVWAVPACTVGWLFMCSGGGSGIGIMFMVTLSVLAAVPSDTVSVNVSVVWVEGTLNVGLSGGRIRQ